MRTLIEERRAGVGRLILPFKEAKIQLLNARLASLKSTLQLLLSVLQYAQTVNIDPNASQWSLSGTWVMAQFEMLIKELQERIGSSQSVVGESSKSSAQDPEGVIGAKEVYILASEIVPASFPTNDTGQVIGRGQKLTAASSETPLPDVSGIKVKLDEPEQAPAKIGLLGDDSGESSDQTYGMRSIFEGCYHVVATVICCPCSVVRTRWRRPERREGIRDGVGQTTILF
ncbi:hypothetical protein BKA61DRAFT_678588 [Leptodontidium sp. MPI-SDFR-AT-0119]|nr:hypothetical protein BKA61DRAFT_678588 [Leptodontidium sp. MPI-SDFR-AT-0119]